MKVKGAAAIILACTMLVGQVAYADEYVGNDVYGDSVKEEYQQEKDTVPTGEEGAPEAAGESIYDESTVYDSGNVSADVYGELSDVDTVEEVAVVSGDSVNKQYSWDLTTQYSVEVEDGTICAATVTTSAYEGKISVQMTGYKRGKTDVYMLDSNGNKVRQFHVTVTPKEQTLYVDVPVEIDIKTYAKDVQVTIEDESICTAKVTERTLSWYNSIKSMKIEGSQTGTTNLQIHAETGIIQDYEIIVKKDLPKDVVKFHDTALQTAISRNGYMDSETGSYVYIYEKGYVSYADLEKVTNLDLSFAGITELTGLEYAVNLGRVSLQYNEGLVDISALQNCVKLYYIDLSGNKKVSDISVLFDKSLTDAYLSETAVSAEDRLKLSGIPDKMCKGDKATSKVYGVWGTGVSVEEKDNAGYVQINSYGPTIIALNEGNTQLEFSCEGDETVLNLTIEGLPSDQEIGEDFEVEVNTVGVYDKSIGVYNAYEYEKAILAENGALWKTYPTAKKVSSNAKEYVAGWVYYTDKRTEAELVEYWLDIEDSLWKDNRKVAENVSKFDVGYALNKSGVLKSLYRLEEEEITQVMDWTTIGNSDNNQAAVTRILKTDGTMWERQEVAKDQTPGEFVKIADNVKELRGNAYIQNDGTYHYSDVDVNFTTQGVSEFADFNGYNCNSFGSIIDNDGRYYYSTDEDLHYLVTEWNGGKKIVYDVNIGNVGKVKNVLRKGYEMYFLNESRELYHYSMPYNATKFATLCIQNVEKLDFVEGDWIAKLTDGTYYMENGDIVNENSGIVLSGGTIFSSEYEFTDCYEMIMKESGEKVATKNGVELLNAVELVWKNNFADSAYALRTDGTIWDITTIPTKIIDLAADDFQKGDVNEDDSVDIQDLRTILRYVCGKTALNERQLKIADVVGDGAVDIQDLRKVLRFVCGKIESLE